MTPFHQYFYPIFGAGLAIAFVASVVAGRTSGYVVPTISLIVGVVSFWAGLFIGSEVGYQMWQSMPNPPAVAFSDTMPMGALIAGWLPAGIFCGFIFGLTRIVKFLTTAGGTAKNEQTINSPVENGNPYQGPQIPNDG